MEEWQRCIPKGNTLILKGYIVYDFNTPEKAKLGSCFKNGWLLGTWGKKGVYKSSIKEFYGGEAALLSILFSIP